ncbi:MAG TPA: hypothetical protein VKW04_06215 [Planctomycetota bacterium]|nr:hypothetical protein [Planctomycetota bacterium]
MSNEALIGIVMLGIMGGLYLIGYLLNAPRAQRWQERMRQTGVVHCGACHQVGTLSVRTTSSGYASSSNMLLACSACGSSEWKVLA